MLLPLKDEAAAHPVPVCWRATLTEVVAALANDSLESLASGAVFAEPAVVSQIRVAVQDYGETLVELPIEVWRSSRCQWMGDCWDVLVDLWTLESGPSDLVLFARIIEATPYRFEIQGVWVP